MSNPKNPFAFPRESNDGDKTGMTLRDYFAAKAMATLLSHSLNTNTIEQFDFGIISRLAYEQADEMLKDRL